MKTVQYTGIYPHTRQLSNIPVFTHTQDSCPIYRYLPTHKTTVQYTGIYPHTRQLSNIPVFTHTQDNCPIYRYLPTHKTTSHPHSHSLQFSQNMSNFLHCYKLTSQSSDDELRKCSCLVFGSMLCHLLRIIFMKR